MTFPTVSTSWFYCLPVKNEVSRVVIVVIGDENRIYYGNPKLRKSWDGLGEPSTSTSKRNIHGHEVSLCI